LIAAVVVATNYCLDHISTHPSIYFAKAGLVCLLCHSFMCL
jgi:hypothetical protein